jgi:Mrp family chromosome partitioning ATPase
MSLSDCRKCLDFCAKLDVPVAGIVENFAGFVCPDCGKRHELFSKGGGASLAMRYGVPLLGQLPIDPVFMSKCDSGNVASALKESSIGTELETVAGII